MQMDGKFLSRRNFCDIVFGLANIEIIDLRDTRRDIPEFSENDVLRM